MWITLIILAGFMLLAVCLFKYEASRSIQISPKEPFFHDDYDEYNDPTLKHQRVFCENCQFFDGINICLAEPMSEVTDARVSHCKTTSMFVPK